MRKIRCPSQTLSKAGISVFREKEACRKNKMTRVQVSWRMGFSKRSSSWKAGKSRFSM